MRNYNKKYDKFIDPLYGAKRDFDEDTLLLQSNVISHSYSVNERIDMTMHKTYSIDPAGCEDADDAFSIYEENEKMFLAYQGGVSKEVEIGSDIWIGARVTVLSNAKIENRIVVGAGSVVTKHLETGFIYCGVPAKKIKKLNK